MLELILYAVLIVSCLGLYVECIRCIQDFNDDNDISNICRWFFCTRKTKTTDEVTIVQKSPPDVPMKVKKQQEDVENPNSLELEYPLLTGSE